MKLSNVTQYSNTLNEKIVQGLNFVYRKNVNETSDKNT